MILLCLTRLRTRSKSQPTSPKHENSFCLFSISFHQHIDIHGRILNGQRDLGVVAAYSPELLLPTLQDPPEGQAGCVWHPQHFQRLTATIRRPLNSFSERACNVRPRRDKVLDCIRIACVLCHEYRARVCVYVCIYIHLYKS